MCNINLLYRYICRNTAGNIIKTLSSHKCLEKIIIKVQNMQKLTYTNKKPF